MADTPVRLVRVPNWPKLLIPQARTVPSLFSARLWFPPAEMATTGSVRKLTATGVLLLVTVPLPNWPESLRPHAETVPSFFSAKLWNRPPAMAFTEDRLLTGTGVFELLLVPLPNWPKPLVPHAETVPSLFSARLW